MNGTERVLAMARFQLGYMEKQTNHQLDDPKANAGSGNFTKYARDLYEAGFFNGNKNGYEWCAVFVTAMVYAVTRDRALTERVLCQTGPLGAGCDWAAKYYRECGRLYHKYPMPGDQIFFRGYAHTGLVEKVEGGRIHTIEGNSSNRVERRQYRTDDSQIDGFGRPFYEWIPDSPFADVSPTDYFFSAAQWAEKTQLISGVAPGIFAPEEGCTRAQAVTMLWRRAGRPEPDSYLPFEDVSPADYYAKAVQWAVGREITLGTSATTFSPDRICTRAEFVTFLWRDAGRPETANESPFVDVAPGDYFAQAVRWAVEKGITSGTDADHFSPDQPCDRAMAVTMLWRSEQCIYG